MHGSRRSGTVLAGIDGGPDPREMQAAAGAAATALFGHARSMGALKGCGILQPPAEAVAASALDSQSCPQARRRASVRRIPGRRAAAADRT